VYAVTAIFGLPLLIAGAMIDPQGLHLRGLLTYTGIMLVLLPFMGGWQLLVTQLVVPTAGRSRVGAVFNLWIGGTLLGVAAISFIASVLSYPRPGTDIDANGHLLIPFMPRAGLRSACLRSACSYRPDVGARYHQYSGHRSRSPVR
jgi:hypothetical protein